jgi:Calx-beta domain
MKPSITTFGIRIKSMATRLVVFGTLIFGLIESSQAQLVYSQNFNTDDSTNWAVNFSYTGGAAFNDVSNCLVNFNFDYTTAGIPVAPHSVLFGSDTIHHGLKISAVYTNPATAKGSAVTAGLSVSPTNFSISDNFIMHADMWINVNCGAYTNLNTNNVSGATYAHSQHNGTASTVLYGCGYGTAGTTATTPGVTDAIFVGALTDTGSGAQMRMYGPAVSPVNAQSSLQDFTYQSTGTVTPGFPGDPYVYNSITAAGSGGTRNWVGSATTTTPPPYTTATNLATGQSWAKYFPPSVVPLAQQILYPQQTNNAACPGLPVFAWHDVSVEKVGSVIIYKIDGNIIATGTYSVCGTPPGSFLTFMASRTTLNVANAVTGNNYTNLNFAVFANIVVSNYDNVVNVAAPTPTCAEGTPGSPGVFTITRSSAGVPLTVNYTLTGTATNGSQYTTLATNVTFASSATATNINVVPIDDGVPRSTTTVILTLQSGTGYQGAGSAIVSILDNNTPTIDITSSATAQAYGRYTNSVGPGLNADFINYTLTRRGKLITGADLSVNLSYAGTGVGGTDYAPVSSVTILDGIGATNLSVVPIDNTSVTSNRTVTVTVASGTGYAIGNGPATGIVVSAHYPANLVLLTNDLQSAGDASNWRITYGCGNPQDNSANFSVDFGMSLAAAAGGITIPPPPNGNANALHLTCNKAGAPSSPGAVNAYYTNLLLSGDYAVRFNMNIIEGQTTENSTEGAVFGINHSGTYSNWWYGGGFITNQTWGSDGIWYYVTAQPGGATAQGDYAEYTGQGGTNNNAGWTRLALKAASSFAQVFKVNPGPFTCFDAAGGGSQTAGQPANASPALGYDASTWSDVEIKQQNSIVTMSINHTTIFTYTNTTVWTGGYLMLGYADPFGATVGNPEAGVYYANLEVVQLAAVITIDSIALSGGNVVVVFTTSSPSDTTASFKLRSSGTVNATYSDVSPPATITSLGNNQFQATTAYTGVAQIFYRVIHN